MQLVPVDLIRHKVPSQQFEKPITKTNDYFCLLFKLAILARDHLDQTAPGETEGDSSTKQSFSQVRK